MITKWKVVGAAVVATLILLSFLAGGLLGVPQGDVSADNPDAPGHWKVHIEKYQPPLPLGYDTVPLDCEEVTVAAMQMVKVPVDVNNPGPGIQQNVDIMLDMCDEAYHDYGARLAVFNEFTLTGFGFNWTREQWLNGNAIMVPGPETEEITDFAREHDMYIAFASHFQQPDWPGHFFNGAIIIGPSGVILTHWKAYWGYPGIGMEYSTTVSDVLDEFVKRHGWDAVWPVARTPIGNLSAYVCSEAFFNAGEIERVYSNKGAEILCRMFGGSGWGNWGGRMKHVFIGACAMNMVWGVDGNGGRDTGPDDPANSMSGSSMIVDPLGNIVAMSPTIRKDIVTWTIPIAEFRTEANRYDKFHNPNTPASFYRGGLRTELFVPEYLQHPNQFPPNLLTEYQKKHKGQLPPDFCTSREWYLEHQRYEFDYNELGDTLCPE
ncbi:nitrilase-related carbon-nitrogen hydrolase [Chloroflexota bacterium]